MREPVGQAVNYIRRELDRICKLANDPATYDEVAAEERELWAIKCRAELLTSRIREKRDAETRLKVVQ
jgi:hypothetical protein